MATQYYVHGPDNRRLGPFTAKQIAKSVSEGEIPDTAYAAPVGGQEWTKIYALPEIAAALKTTTMPFHRANLNGIETEDPGVPIGTATVVGVSPAVNAAIASATAASAARTTTPPAGAQTVGPPSVEVAPYMLPPQAPLPGPPMITPPGTLIDSLGSAEARSVAEGRRGVSIDQMARPPQGAPDGAAAAPPAPPPSMPAGAAGGGTGLRAMIDRIPRKMLPIYVFGACAAFGALETLIVVIARAI